VGIVPANRVRWRRPRLGDFSSTPAFLITHET
jgi:hypothetical protein